MKIEIKGGDTIEFSERECHNCSRVRTCLLIDNSCGEYPPMILCIQCLARFAYIADAASNTPPSVTGDNATEGNAVPTKTTEPK